MYKDRVTYVILKIKTVYMSWNLIYQREEEKR